MYKLIYKVIYIYIKVCVCVCVCVYIINMCHMHTYNIYIHMYAFIKCTSQISVTFFWCTHSQIYALSQMYFWSFFK